MRTIYDEIHPARARAKDPEKIWGDPAWIAEEKLDGWRFLMHFGGGLERTYLTGRRTSVATGRLSEKGLNVPCLWPWLNQLEIGYTVLDGEIMSPTGNWRDIAGIMNVGNPSVAALRIAEIGAPRYRVFDILYAANEDVRCLPLIDRRNVLVSTIKHLGHHLITIVPWLDAQPSTLEKILTRGGEGIILKNIYSHYDDPCSWIKVKKAPTVDVIVTGFTEAREGVTGKYLGQIGAARVSVYLTSGELVEVGCVSGMDDTTRLDMSISPGRWIGKVIEVVAQEFAKDRLRHPRFRRLREDADPRSATYAKMMHDLGQSDRRADTEQLELFR